MPRVEVPEPTLVWLRETGALLRQASAALEESAGGWSPDPGSHAEWELKEAERLGLGDLPAVVPGVLFDWTEAADAYLKALATQAAAGEVTHSVPYLVRAVLEHAYKILWLLEPRSPEPESQRVTSVQRAARAYLEELFSLKHRRDTVKKMYGEGSEAFRKCEHAFQEMRAETIPALFPSELGVVMLEGEHSKWRIVGERWRGPSALAKRYEGGGSDKPPIGTYDALSAYSHPTLYPHRELVEYLPQEGGGLLRRRTISPNYLGRLIGGASVAFWDASRHVISYFGWSQTPLEEWSGEFKRWQDRLPED